VLRDYLVGHINYRIENKKTKYLTDDVGKSLLKMSAYADVDMSTQVLVDIINESNVNKKHIRVTELNFDILKKMMHWQLIFYKLGGGNDKEVEHKYLLLYGEHVELYNDFVSGMGKMEGAEEEITYKINYSLPLAENLRLLDKFVDATKMSLSIMYKAMEGVLSGCGEIGLMPFLIFQKDVIGNESKWYKTFEEWAICYCLYKMYCLVGKNKSDLIRFIIKEELFLNLNFTEDDMSNSIHKLDNNYLNEACRLVASAQKGTFPI